MEVTFSDQGIERQLDKILDRMERPAGFYKNVGEHIQMTTQERMAAEQAPDGSSWERLSPVTLPARPYLGLSPEDERAILEIAEDYVGL